MRVGACAHAAGAARVIGAFCVLADEFVNGVIAGHVIAWLDLAAGIVAQGRLVDDLAGQADAAAEFLPVFFVGHVVEVQLRRLLRVGGYGLDRTARLGPHRADMNLEAVSAGGRLAVVGNGARQEMILDVRVLDAGARADETGAFEMVGCAKAGLEQQPLQPDQALRQPVELAVERNGKQ
jgi:hypothetical protein